jgi:hypothetical protein
VSSGRSGRDDSVVMGILPSLKRLFVVMPVHPNTMAPPREACLLHTTQIGMVVSGRECAQIVVVAEHFTMC